MSKKIIAFNWKMNPASEKEAKSILDVISKSEISYKKNELIVFPPTIYLDDLKTYKPKNLKLGVENVFYSDRGAHTGEISPKMAKNAGAKYVLIGHSERRAEGETDLVISKKIQAALADRLKVILCVGEPLEIRKKGISAAKKFVSNQIRKNLSFIENYKLKIEKSLFIAYEPVWAISTAKDHKDETPQDALEMIKYIKQLLVTSYKFKVNVLYGGSVNSKNILAFINHKEINGALIGGASVDKKELSKLLKLI